MRQDIRIDPLEIAGIEERLLDTVRAITSPAGNTAPLSSLGA